MFAGYWWCPCPRRTGRSLCNSWTPSGAHCRRGARRFPGLARVRYRARRGRDVRAASSSSERPGENQTDDQNTHDKQGLSCVDTLNSIRMNDLPTLHDESLEAPEHTAGDLLSQVDARSELQPPSPFARGLLSRQGAVELDRVAEAALLVHPNNPLNTVNQIIVCLRSSDGRPPRGGSGSIES